jgi:hypothetical protein
MTKAIGCGQVVMAEPVTLMRDRPSHCPGLGTHELP